MTTTQITIEFDQDRLSGCTDSYLAMLWHLAQANPAPHGDPTAGDLAERIGREIIRRWLRDAPVELWHHQGHSYYWRELTKLAKYKPGDGPVGSPEWHRGTWEPKLPGDHDVWDTLDPLGPFPGNPPDPEPGVRS